jgi:multidrug efflux pump
MALVTSTGFVVDDAIDIENIARYVEDGVPPMQAALQGKSRSVSRSFLDGVADRGTDSAVVHGRRGRRLFHEFAITLAVAILISALSR